MTSINNDDYNSVLFNKVFKNIFIKSKIIKFLCTYSNIDYYYLYQDRESNLTSKEIKRYQDYFDEIKEYKLEFKIYNYNEIDDLEWIVKNKQYSLLYDKLIMSTRLSTTTTTTIKTTIKVTEDSIYKFCEFNSDFQLFKLFYSIYGSEYFCKENTRLIQKTVQSGSIEIVKYLVEQGFKFDYESLRFATSYGYLEILKYLIQANPYISFNNNVVDFVRVDPIDLKRVDSKTGIETIEECYNIGLDIAKYLKQIKPEIRFTPIAIDYACISGNIDMVKYYQNEISMDNDNVKLKVSKQGLIGAIVGNHIELLKYLLIDGNLSTVESTIFGPISISIGIDEAIKKGHIESVKFIYYNLNGSNWSITGIKNAAKYNHINILKFIFSIDLENILSNNKNYSIVDCSTKSNNLQLVQYLHEIGFKNCSLKSIYNSTKRNNFEIVKFIYSNYNQSKLFSFKSLENSIKNENIQLFDYLMQQEPNIINLINNCGITNNIKSSVLFEICINKKNCTLLKLVMDTLKQHNITIPFRKESLLSLAIQVSHLETIEFLLSLPGFKITRSLILLSNNKKIASYLYNEYINNNTNTNLLNYLLIIENKSILSNVNLIKFHLKYQQNLNNLISSSNNNNNLLLSEKEILLSASIGNNLNVLKYIFKKNNGKLFSFNVLREAILSNSLENVVFILENLDLSTITLYPIIDSSINNLEILKYLHNFKHAQFKATTNAIDEATSLNQYMTVLFLLTNRNEGFTKQALQNSQSKFPSINNLLNNHIHLLNRNL